MVTPSLSLGYEIVVGSRNSENQMGKGGEPLVRVRERTRWFIIQNIFPVMLLPVVRPDQSSNARPRIALDKLILKAI